MTYRKIAQATYKFIYRSLFKQATPEHTWFKERLDDGLVIDENTEVLELMDDFLNWRDGKGLGHD